MRALRSKRTRESLVECEAVEGRGAAFANHRAPSVEVTFVHLPEGSTEFEELQHDVALPTFEELPGERHVRTERVQLRRAAGPPCREQSALRLGDIATAQRGAAETGVSLI